MHSFLLLSYEWEKRRLKMYGLIIHKLQSALPHPFINFFSHFHEFYGYARPQTTVVVVVAVVSVNSFYDFL